MPTRRVYGLSVTAITLLALYHLGRLGGLRSSDFLTFSSPLGSALYRERLGSLRSTDNLPHSRTLGAGVIYVINLAGRTDRRKSMSQLARALDIDLTWHNATHYRDESVMNIMERLRWWRNENRVNAADPRRDPSPFNFEWQDDIQQEEGPLGLKGSDWWTQPLLASNLPLLPPVPSPDDRPAISGTTGESGRDFDAEDVIRPQQVACWKSHYDVLRKVAEGDDGIAIILEDDVDPEWHLERRLQGFFPALPPNWDVLMISHCSSDSETLPSLPSSPFLRPANEPLCTSGYAVTRRGAQRLARHLRSAPFAYSRPIDHAFVHLVHHQRLHDRHPDPAPGTVRSGAHFFSVTPPVVVQTYASVSDIVSGGVGGRQKDWLEDSTQERIQLNRLNEQ
ncbi:hypothetical protein C8J57DRAFT_1495598 [Mycena rebaudengoi]|nr:hypothetical protein C8J57DRAFT_1495598 [Mycena rebaudengoi]